MVTDLSSPPRSSVGDHLPSVSSDEFLPAIGPWIRWGGVFLVATVGSVFTLAATIRYTPVVEASGVLKHEGDRYEVEVPVDGVITQVRVKPNQAVQQGEAIATLTPANDLPVRPILAPISGTILELDVNYSIQKDAAHKDAAQVVIEGDEIATITPTSAPLTLKAYVFPEDVGKVTPCRTPVITDCPVGRALVRMPSFSQTEHAPLSAAVREISPDTILLDNEALFELTLELPSSQSMPASMPLRSGMSVQVDILTQPRTMLSLFKE